MQHSDIVNNTKEHEAELEAALERRRFRMVVDELNAAVFEWDLKKKKFYCSEAYGKYAVSRVSEEDVLNNCGPMDTVHPEDVAILQEFFKETKAGKERVEVVLRLKMLDGTYRWCRMLGFYYKDEDGVPSRTVGVIIDIHEEHEYGAEMERSRERDLRLLSSIPGGIAVYRLKKNGVVSADYVSEGLARMCGYDYEEFVSYISANAMVNVPNGEIPRILEAARKSLETNQPVSINYHIHTKNGPDILIRLDANVIGDSELGEDDLAVWYAVHTVVTEDAKQALREQKYYRMILNMTGTAYFEWDCETGFYSSDTFMQYTISDDGFDAIMGSREGLRGVYPSDRPALIRYVKRMKNGQFSEGITIRMKMHDGGYHWTEIMGYAERDEAGRFTRLAGVMRDVDKERNDQNAKLQEALEKAQKSDRAKSEFLSQMSHEIRTPMNGIIGMTKLAQGSAIDPKTKEYLQEIDESSQYMLGLLNDVLDMSRIESGRLELNQEWVNVTSTLWPCIQMLETMMRAKNITFVHPDTSKRVNVEFYVDPLRIKQIIMNLLNNAYKFTPGGGTIEMEIKNLTHDEKHAVDQVTIRDTGCGMSEEFLKNGIFKAFSQEQNEFSNSLRGTGLGLAIVKEIVEKMNGTIEVTSKLHEGTTFIVTLAYDYRVQKKKIVDAMPECDIKKLTGRLLLLADDHPLNRKIIKLLLEKVGMIVEEAENGAEAVKLFEASEVEYYSAILMDIRMPIMDGLDATRAIRALERPDAGTVPIIAITANDFAEDIRKSREAGMNTHLAKPVEPQLLYETLVREMQS